MRYNVDWLNPAIGELANLWTQGPDRQALSDAADAIDRLLRDSPEKNGLDWGDGERYLVVPPLVAIIKIVPDDCRVWVIEIWRLPHSSDE